MKLLLWLRRVFGGPPNGAVRNTKETVAKTFLSCVVVQSPPANESVAVGVFVVVASGGKNKWVLFRCPCGCGQVITLALSRHRKPNWTVTMESGQGPSLYPSVRQLDGCLSHFWIKAGRVYWCRDTGKRYEGEDI